jgi:hypothetical protein
LWWYWMNTGCVSAMCCAMARTTLPMSGSNEWWDVGSLVPRSAPSSLAALSLSDVCRLHSPDTAFEEVPPDQSREVPSKSFGRSAPNPFRLPRPSVGAHLARKDARQSAISGAAGPSSRRDFCYERVSRKPGRYPGRNSISAADVTNRLGTTRWTSTPSQFVNPEMTECSPAASARKPSRPTRSAGSNPSKGHPAPRYFLEL